MSDMACDDGALSISAFLTGLFDALRVFCAALYVTAGLHLAMQQLHPSLKARTRALQSPSRLASLELMFAARI